MDTNRLRQFKTLVETGNMRKAASLLGISNGGLSRSIRVLEEDLRTKLIVAAGRGIAITDAGKEIYAKIGPLMVQVEALSQAERRASVRPRLSLGTFEVFSTYFLGPLAQKHLQGFDLLLREYVPGKLEAAIAEKEVDLGITYLPVPRAGVDFVEVGRVEMGIFGRKDSFAGEATEEMPFVVPITPVEGSPTGVKGLDGWPDHLFPRRVRFEVEMMESALELCRSGLCVGFFPSFVIRLHNRASAEKLRLEPLRLPARFKTVRRPVYIVKRHSRQEERLMRLVARAVREVTSTPNAEYR